MMDFLSGLLGGFGGGVASALPAMGQVAGGAAAAPNAALGLAMTQPESWAAGTTTSAPNWWEALSDSQRKEIGGALKQGLGAFGKEVAGPQRSSSAQMQAATPPPSQLGGMGAFRV